jgi:L-aspartate oxidase
LGIEFEVLKNMKKDKNNTFQSDFLIIGTGIAGLSFAIRAAEHGKVVIITKKKDIETNTNYAQGGIASVLKSEDSFESHIQDTLSCGGGICSPASVRFLVENGPAQIKQLMEWGAHFTRDKKRELELGREGGHSANRIVHTRDYTGREVERAMLHKAKSSPNIQIFEDHFAIDLITEHQARSKKEFSGRISSEKITCFGAYALDIQANCVKKFLSKITILSTGGSGRVYLHTTNPDIATGDGIGMAYRAGAIIGNMEFFQFHPTSVYHHAGNSFLISEALRGYGAILKNKAGYAFMKDFHTMESLAPRDIVARAIDTEMKKSAEPCVYLDITQADAEETKEKFPLIYARCLELGINMTHEPIPVVPAAHYMCGGVKVDMNSRTNINRLYACGETAFTGVHGANRLASNSLLEALVFTESGVRDSVQKLDEINKETEDPEIPDWDEQGTIDTEESILVEHNREEIRRLMWNYVGIVRSNDRLARARARLALLEKEVQETYKRTSVYPNLLELRNFLVTAKLIVESAIFRKESRGLHYNFDYPEENDKWRGCSIIEHGKEPYLEPTE